MNVPYKFYVPMTYKYVLCPVWCNRNVIIEKVLAFVPIEWNDNICCNAQKLAKSLFGLIDVKSLMINWFELEWFKSLQFKSVLM